MSQTDAAHAQEEEQLLTRWRKLKHALKEAKMNVKDTQQRDKEFENACESTSGGKDLRSKAVGQEAREHAQAQEQRNLNTTEVNQRSE